MGPIIILKKKRLLILTFDIINVGEILWKKTEKEQKTISSGDVINYPVFEKNKPLPAVFRCGLVVT